MPLLVHPAGQACIFQGFQDEVLSPSIPKTCMEFPLGAFYRCAGVLRSGVLQDLSNSCLGSGIQSQFAVMEIPVGSRIQPVCGPALLAPRLWGLAPSKPLPSPSPELDDKLS